MTEEDSVGQLIRRAREAKGLSLEALATELKLPLRHLEAIEGDHWEALPPGRPRPLARQLAARLEVDLEYHTGAFQIVPGVQELEPPDPRQERLERVVMGVLTAVSVLVLLWLVVPGPRLGHKPPPSYLTVLTKPTLPPPPAPSASPVSRAWRTSSRGSLERAGRAGEPPGHGHLQCAHPEPQAELGAATLGADPSSV